MEAHRIETTVQPHGRVVLENLPFEDGEKVEVIVIETKESKKKNSGNPYPLHGTPYKYDDPFSPLISPEDWEPLNDNS